MREKAEFSNSGSLGQGSGDVKISGLYWVCLYLGRPVNRRDLLTPNFIRGWICSFLHALAFNLMVHLPGHLKVLGAGEVAIGAIMGTFAVTAVISRPWVGAAIERYGYLGIIRGGSLLHVVACAAYLTITAITPWVYVVRGLHGLVEGALFTGLFALAVEEVPQSRRIQAIGLFGVSGMLPVSLGAVLGDHLKEIAGMQEVFLAAVLFALLGCLIQPEVSARQAPVSPPTGGLREVLLHRPLWVLAALALVIDSALTAHFTFLGPALLTRETPSVGPFFTAYALMAILLRLVAGNFPEKFGPTRVLQGALLLGALGQVMLSTLPIGLALVGTGLVCGAGHAFAFPVILGLSTRLAPPGREALSMAMISAVWDAGAPIGGPLLGAIAAAHGYPALFRAAALGFVVAVVIAGRIPGVSDPSPQQHA